MPVPWAGRRCGVLLGLLCLSGRGLKEGKAAKGKDTVTAHCVNIFQARSCSLLGSRSIVLIGLAGGLCCRQRRPQRSAPRSPCLPRRQGQTRSDPLARRKEQQQQQQHLLPPPPAAMRPPPPACRQPPQSNQRAAPRAKPPTRPGHIAAGLTPMQKHSLPRAAGSSAPTPLLALSLISRRSAYPRPNSGGLGHHDFDPEAAKRPCVRSVQSEAR